MAEKMQEPSADMRKAARAVKEYYEALVEAGFTDYQALVIVGQTMGTMGSAGQR